MPKELPDISRIATRLVKTGRVKDIDEANVKLAPMAKLYGERQSVNKYREGLNIQAHANGEEIMKEQHRRIEILEKVFEGRKKKIEEHFHRMAKVGIEPFHEEMHHQSARMTVLEKEIEQEREQFEQFDAEDRLVALHSLKEAFRGDNQEAIEQAKQTLLDMLEEQGLIKETKKWEEGIDERAIDVLFVALEYWAKREIQINRLVIDDYRGKVNEKGYLEEPVIKGIIEGVVVEKCGTYAYGENEKGRTGNLLDGQLCFGCIRGMILRRKEEMKKSFANHLGLESDK